MNGFLTIALITAAVSFAATGRWQLITIACGLVMVLALIYDANDRRAHNKWMREHK